MYLYRKRIKMVLIMSEQQAYTDDCSKFLPLTETVGDLLCGVWNMHDCAAHNGYRWRIGCILYSEQLIVCVYNYLLSMQRFIVNTPL